MKFRLLPPGIGQHTRATQALSALAGPSGAPRLSRRRRRVKKSAASSLAPRKRRRAGAGKMRKGSAAAKRHMAKLRRMRRK